MRIDEINKEKQELRMIVAAALGLFVGLLGVGPFGMIIPMVAVWLHWWVRPSSRRDMRDEEFPKPPAIERKDEDHHITAMDGSEDDPTMAVWDGVGVGMRYETVRLKWQQRRQQPGGR